MKINLIRDKNFDVIFIHFPRSKKKEMKKKRIFLNERKFCSILSISRLCNTCSNNSESRRMAKINHIPLFLSHHKYLPNNTILLRMIDKYHNISTEFHSKIHKDGRVTKQCCQKRKH